MINTRCKEQPYTIISIPEPETEHKKKKIKIKSEYLEPTSHKRKYREKNENNAQGSKVRVKRAEWRCLIVTIVTNAQGCYDDYVWLRETIQDY